MNLKCQKNNLSGHLRPLSFGCPLKVDLNLRENQTLQVHFNMLRLAPDSKNLQSTRATWKFLKSSHSGKEKKNGFYRVEQLSFMKLYSKFTR